MDNKLIDVKATLVADANEKLPFTFTVENATFGEPTLLDPTVVSMDVPGVRNSEVDVGVNGGATIVKMKYNRLHLDVLFANTDQPFPYTGDPNLTSYLPYLNSIVLANIQPDDIEGGQLVTTDNVNYSVDLTAAANSLGYFGQTSLTFRLSGSGTTWEGDPNNLLTWWPLDWVVPLNADDFGANEPTYVAWESGSRTQGPTGNEIPAADFDNKLSVTVGGGTDYLMRVSMGDPVRNNVGVVSPGVTYVETSLKIDAAHFGNAVPVGTDVAFYWALVHGQTTLVGPLVQVDRNSANTDGDIELTVRLDFTAAFTLTENYRTQYPYDPDVESPLSEGLEEIVNGGTTALTSTQPTLALRAIYRSAQGNWSHASNLTDAPMFVAVIQERPGFNIAN